MDIKLYTKELIKDFKYNGVEQEVSGEDITELVEYYSRIGTVYVGIVGGKAIGVGGVYPLYSGMGSCFLLLNKEADKYKKSLYKEFMVKISELVGHYNITTLAVDCLDESDKAKSLIEHLGFKKTRDIKMSFYAKGVIK